MTAVPGRGGEAGKFLALNLYIDVAVADFTGVHLRAFALPAARSIFKSNMPAVPATDDFTQLHDSFAERKSEVRAEIFDRINRIVPAEQRDVQTSRLYGVTETLRWKVGQAGDPCPFIVHAIMLYFRRWRRI